MTSRIAELSILDVLYVGVALRRYEISLKSIERTKETLAEKNIDRYQKEGEESNYFIWVFSE